VVITFHSLEDRIVKWALRGAAGQGRGRGEDVTGLRARGVELFAGEGEEEAPVVRLVSRRPLVAGEVEVRENPRARSAKLRVVQKL
jgi:16S rRNA (cytosine1402-N4)-methyltransferase